MPKTRQQIAQAIKIELHLAANNMETLIIEGLSYPEAAIHENTVRHLREAVRQRCTRKPIGEVELINTHRIITPCEHTAEPEPITRQQFMDFFRHDDRNEHLTTDDTIEIFIQILKGDSDLSPELFEEVCNEYGTTLDDVLQNKR